MKPCFLEEIKFSEMVVFEGDYNLIENDAVKIYSPSDFDFEKLKHKKILCCDTSLAHILYWQSIECDVVVYYRGTSDHYLYRQAKTFITKQTTAKVKTASSSVGGTIKLNVKLAMNTTNAVISAFVFAWIVPPYSWLVYEFLNPTEPFQTRAWKYYFDSDVTSELSFLVVSIVAFFSSSIGATSAGLLLTKISPLSI